MRTAVRQQRPRMTARCGGNGLVLAFVIGLMMIILCARAEIHGKVAHMYDLFVYNRPPKTGSTTIRSVLHYGMKKIGWRSISEATMLRIIENRQSKCIKCVVAEHMQLSEERRRKLDQMYGGRVFYVTSTRTPLSRFISNFKMQIVHNERHNPGYKYGWKLKIVGNTTEELFEDYLRKVDKDTMVHYHFAEKKQPLDFIPSYETLRPLVNRYDFVVGNDNIKADLKALGAYLGVDLFLRASLNERHGHEDEVAALANRHLNETDTLLCSERELHDTLMDRRKEILTRPEYQ